MNKKIIILVAIVLLLIIGGVFLWKNREIKGDPGDYIIEEAEGIRIVENKRAGLKVEVPEGWEVEKIEIEEGSVIFYSPDAEGMRPDRVRPPLKKGCMIEAAVGYERMSFEDIKAKLEEGHKSLGMRSDRFETVEVNGKPVLKNTFDCVELGYSIAVYFSVRDKLYQLSINTGPESIGKCSQEFDKFLETVSIE